MKWKTIIGILLMIVSIGCMYMWENYWRDEVCLDKVLAASKDIEAGEVISADDIKLISVTPQSRVNGSFDVDGDSSLIGKLVTCRIRENQQLTADYVTDFEDIKPEGYYSYVIPSEWISPSSSSLCSGDIITFRSLPSKQYLGTYELVSVYENGNMEICCDTEDFYRIYDCTAEGNTVVAVKEE